MIAAVMPAKGRPVRTVEAIQRLLRCAGVDSSRWMLVIVVDGDPDLYRHLRRATYADNVIITTSGGPASIGYWRSLAVGIAAAGDPEYVVNLANDLLPGADWLARQMVLAEKHGKLGGVCGFNDGIQTDQHAAHFLAPAALLREWYGAARSPTMYHHMYGDKEISVRSQAAGLFWANPWAVLYHNHVYVGADMDAVYLEGHSQTDSDRHTFYQRQAARIWRSQDDQP